MTITINGLNDDPVITRFITQNMTEDEDAVEATVTSLDVDTYHTATYSIVINDGVDRVTVNYAHGDFGSLTLNKTRGFWKYVPTESLVTVLNGYMKNFNASTSSAGADLNVIYLSRQYQPKRLRLFLDFLIERFHSRFPE